MKPYPVLLLIVAAVGVWCLSCATSTAIPIPVKQEPPGLLDGAGRIWLPSDVGGDVEFCVNLFEPDAAYNWKCISVRSLRIMINGLKVAD